jgi:hypothetical protein
MVRFKKFLEEQIKAGQFHSITWTMLEVRRFWEKATVSHILLGKLKEPGTLDNMTWTWLEDTCRSQIVA